MLSIFQTVSGVGEATDPDKKKGCAGRSLVEKNDKNDANGLGNKTKTAVKPAVRAVSTPPPVVKQQLTSRKPMAVESKASDEIKAAPAIRNTDKKHERTGQDGPAGRRSMVGSREGSIPASSARVKPVPAASAPATKNDGKKADSGAVKPIHTATVGAGNKPSPGECLLMCGTGL